MPWAPGFQLALACDLRVCAADAMFSMRETSLGLVPDLGGTQPLVEAVGYSRALEICVTGRWVDAEEAREIGLATIVVPLDDLDAATSDLAEALAAPMPETPSPRRRPCSGRRPGRSYTDQLAAERMSQVRRLRTLVDALAAGAAEQSGNKGGLNRCFAADDG